MENMHTDIRVYRVKPRLLLTLILRKRSEDLYERLMSDKKGQVPFSRPCPLLRTHIQLSPVFPSLFLLLRITLANRNFTTVSQSVHK